MSRYHPTSSIHPRTPTHPTARTPVPIHLRYRARTRVHPPTSNIPHPRCAVRLLRPRGQHHGAGVQVRQADLQDAEAHSQDGGGANALYRPGPVQCPPRPPPLPRAQPFRAQCTHALSPGLIPPAPSCWCHRRQQGGLCVLVGALCLCGGWVSTPYCGARCTPPPAAASVRGLMDGWMD